MLSRPSDETGHVRRSPRSGTWTSRSNCHRMVYRRRRRGRGREHVGHRPGGHLGVVHAAFHGALEMAPPLEGPHYQAEQRELKPDPHP